MKSHKIKVNDKDYELAICDKIGYTETQAILDDAIKLCFEGNEVLSYSADFAIDTALILNTVKFGEFDGEVFNAEFFWQLIHEFGIISVITESVKDLQYGKIKKAFFNIYNEKLRIALNPWSSAAIELIGLIKTLKSNQDAMADVDINKLMELSSAIADKSEEKIVDGILDFHEKSKK